jgi:hypothetical protein
MRYLKTFEQVTDRISVFDTEGWESLLPKTLTIVTDSGEWTLEKPTSKFGMGHAANVTGLMNCLQINYHQNTVDEENGDVTADGEPDLLGFDITMVKDNDGSESNPETLRLDVDITYGDSMKSEFSVTMPNEVVVGHYNGYGSKYDSETSFAFDEYSIESLVRFFNSFGFSITREDLAFLTTDQMRLGR